MNVYKAIGTELYHYGTRRISGACYRQKPTTIGTCRVQVTSCGCTTTEPPMSHAQANDFVWRMLLNYPMNEYTLRPNKRTAGVIYYASIINNKTRREELSVKIID